MDIEDIKRINSLVNAVRNSIVTTPIVPINKYHNYTVNNKKMEIYFEPDKGLQNIITPIITQQNDLEFLVEQGVLDVKTEDEMIQTYGTSPKQAIQSLNTYAKLLNEEYTLQKENDKLKIKLKPLHKVLSMKSTIEKIEAQIYSNEQRLKKIDETLTESEKELNAYKLMRGYVMTEKGTYIAIKKDMNSFVDINSDAGKIQISYNELNKFLRDRVDKAVNLKDKMHYEFNILFKKAPVEELALYMY